MTSTAEEGSQRKLLRRSSHTGAALRSVLARTAAVDPVLVAA